MSESAKKDAKGKMAVTLRPITADSWRACIGLEVKEGQAGFLSSNLYSIAEAQFYPQATPQAIYDEQDVMVGFVLYGVDVESGKLKIFRFMIDQAHQGRGYRRAAMEQVIERLRGEPDCCEILIAYQVENHAARRLHESLGLVKESVNDGKVAARRQLGDEQETISELVKTDE